MFANHQITKLFSLIESIQGSAEDIETGALMALHDEVASLKSRDQILVKGSHEHKSGESLYLYLVPKDQPFGENHFEKLLNEEFEPEKGEFISTETIDEPLVIE